MKRKVKIVLMGLMLTIVFALGCSPEAKKERLEEKGKKAFENGETSVSLDYFNQAEELGELSPESKKYVFTIYIEQAKNSKNDKQFEQAISNYEKAEKYGQLSKDDNYQCSHCYFSMAEADENIFSKVELYEKGLQIDSSDETAVIALIRAYESSSSIEYTKGILAFEEYGLPYREDYIEDLNKCFERAFKRSIELGNTEVSDKTISIYLDYICLNPQFRIERYLSSLDFSSKSSGEITSKDFGEKVELPVFQGFDLKDGKESVRRLVIFYYKILLTERIFDDIYEDGYSDVDEYLDNKYYLESVKEGWTQYLPQIYGAKTDLNEAEIGDIVVYGEYNNNPAVFYLAKKENNNLVLIPLSNIDTIEAYYEVDMTKYQDIGEKRVQFGSVEAKFRFDERSEFYFPSEEEYKDSKDALNNSQKYNEFVRYWGTFQEELYRYRALSLDSYFKEACIGFTDVTKDVWYVPIGEVSYSRSEETKQVNGRLIMQNVKAGIELYEKEWHKFAVYRIQGCYMDEETGILQVRPMVKIAIE